jgi:hypothetical protein
MSDTELQIAGQQISEQKLPVLKQQSGGSQFAKGRGSAVRRGSRAPGFYEGRIDCHGEPLGSANFQRLVIGEMFLCIFSVVG